jgi:serine/threonine protein kinase
VDTPAPPPQPAPREAEAERTDEVPRLTTPDLDLGQTAPDLGLPPSGSPAAPPTGRRRITALGDYQLGPRLGAGAMGAVYRAWQVSKDRPAAVKVLRPHLAKNRVFLERFRREAEVMARLSHPNIVRCYGAGKQFGRHYLAMELVEGASLGDWLYRLGRLAVGDAVHIALAVGRALSHAHQNSLVHRDVKPDNILVTPDGAVKLADLGLAKDVEGALSPDANTQAVQGAGTPVYMAPEQARSGHEADPRSDLYALGCVLYHMLTGQFPFRGASSLDVILAKVEGHYTPARDVNPEVPPELEAVLDVLLAADPDARYQSAPDLVNELEELNLAYRSLRFLRDHAAGPGSRPTSTPTDLTTVAEEKLWYVLHQSAEGQWVTRRLTTTEVIRALDDGHFAQTAQASLCKGDYRFLTDFPEFRAVLGARSGQLSAVRPRPEEKARPRAEGRKSWAALDRLLGRLVVLALFLGVAALGFWLGMMLIP